MLIGLAAGIASYFFLVRPELAKTEEGLSVVASQIAGRSVSIDCQGVISDAVDITNREGEVEFDETGRPADSAQLKRDVCKRLGELEATASDVRYRCLVSAEECPDDILKNVVAVHTLSHESWHLAGIKDERITECYAMQTNEMVAIRLGAPENLARAIAVYYTSEIYPQLSTMYRSNSCRDRGRYDLDRASRRWP